MFFTVLDTDPEETRNSTRIQKKMVHINIRDMYGWTTEGRVLLSEHFSTSKDHHNPHFIFYMYPERSKELWANLCVVSSLYPRNRRRFRRWIIRSSVQIEALLFSGAVLWGSPTKCTMVAALILLLVMFDCCSMNMLYIINIVLLWSSVCHQSWAPTSIQHLWSHDHRPFKNSHSVSETNSAVETKRDWMFIFGDVFFQIWCSLTIVPPMWLMSDSGSLTFFFVHPHLDASS